MSLPSLELIDRTKIQNGYELTSRESQRLRRVSSVEFSDETGKQAQLSDFESLITVAQARHLHRNYTQAKSMLGQLQMHVVGCGNRVIFETDDKGWNASASTWHEKVWGRNCDGRDDRTIHELNGLFLMSVIREHDCLAWFDRGGIIESGKIFYWETDQICNLRDKDFKAKINTIARRVGWSGRTASLRQSSGVIYARTGKPLGYIVHPGRGLTEVAWDKATVLPYGPARLIKKNWRLGQRRGVADMLTAAASLVDSYEMLESELASAKTVAHMPLVIKTEDAHQVARNRADESDGQAAEVGLADTNAGAFTNYRNFERLSRGAIEYMEPGDSVEVLDNKRLGPNLATFLDAQAINAGGSMGLPRFFALMKADASFSAVRGEMNLGKVTFSCLQAFLENHLLRWEVTESVSYAVATGQLPPAPAGWEMSYCFDHPVLEPLDEDKLTRSNERALRTVQKTWRDIHGPDWQLVMDQAAQERAYAREIGLELGLENQTNQEPQTIEVATK
jgi:capsid protein